MNKSILYIYNSTILFELFKELETAETFFILLDGKVINFYLN